MRGFRPRRVVCLLTLGAATAFAAVQSNASLTGFYYFRQVLIDSDGVNVTQMRSASGTLIFDGAGNFTFLGQQLVDATPAAALSGAGVYSVKSSGVKTSSGVRSSTRKLPPLIA